MAHDQRFSDGSHGSYSGRWLGPSLPAAARLRIESRIIAGERVGAPEIRKARGALKTGRPDVKQARRMAA
jgi:hypothetical protein